MKELKHDELAETQRWAQQAKAVQGNIFRWLAQTRDTAAVSTRARHNSALAGWGRLSRFAQEGMDSVGRACALAWRTCSSVRGQACTTPNHMRCLCPCTRRACTSMHAWRCKLTCVPAHLPPPPHCLQGEQKDTRIFRF